MEFSDGAAVPEWLWRRFDGEFVMVDHWGAPLTQCICLRRPPALPHKPPPGLARRGR